MFDAVEDGEAADGQIAGPEPFDGLRFEIAERTEVKGRVLRRCVLLFIIAIIRSERKSRCVRFLVDPCRDGNEGSRDGQNIEKMAGV